MESCLSLQMRRLFARRLRASYQTQVSAELSRLHHCIHAVLVFCVTINSRLTLGEERYVLHSMSPVTSLSAVEFKDQTTKPQNPGAY